MTAVTTSLAATSSNLAADDIDHCVCHCNHDVALCGKPVTNENWIDEYTNPCIVCLDLETQPCPTCGD